MKYLNFIKIKDFILSFFIVVIGVFILVVISYPLLYVVISSISSSSMREGFSLIPKQVTFEGYIELFKNPNILRGLINSIIYTTVGCAFSTTLTVLCAFPLSRKDFYLGKYLFFFFALTMYFNGGMIPTYLLVKNLGLINSMWSLILPSALSVYNMMLLTSSFSKNITQDLLDTARLDRCNQWRFLVRVAIPMVAPNIIVIALFYVVSYWNSYFEAMIYITDPEKLPLANVLRDILILNQDSVGSWNTGIDSSSGISIIEKARLLEYALIVVASFPMIVVSFFTNNYTKKFKN